MRGALTTSSWPASEDHDTICSGRGRISAFGPRGVVMSLRQWMTAMVPPGRTTRVASRSIATGDSPWRILNRRHAPQAPSESPKPWAKTSRSSLRMFANESATARARVVSIISGSMSYAWTVVPVRRANGMVLFGVSQTGGLIHSLMPHRPDCGFRRVPV